MNKQLTDEQKVEIRAHLKTDRSLSQIAELIGVNKPMVSREIVRNRELKGYRFRQAHEKAFSRRCDSGKKIRFISEIKAEVIKRLKDDWSPKQISSYSKAEGGHSVSYETSCRFNVEDKGQGSELHRHLRLGRKNFANTVADKFQTAFPLTIDPPWLMKGRTPATGNSTP